MRFENRESNLSVSLPTPKQSLQAPSALRPEAASYLEVKRHFFSVVTNQDRRFLRSAVAKSAAQSTSMLKDS